MRVSYRESILKPITEKINFFRVLKGRPFYFNLTLMLDPIDPIASPETKGENTEILFNFKRAPEFDIYYKEYKKRITMRDRK